MRLKCFVLHILILKSSFKKRVPPFDESEMIRAATKVIFLNNLLFSHEALLNALLFYDVVIRRKRKSSIRLIGLTDFVF